MAYESVAYDKSITFKNGFYRATIRHDDEILVHLRHSLREAQKLLACFPNEVYEGPSVQPSVFYRGGGCETLVM